MCSDCVGRAVIKGVSKLSRKDSVEGFVLVVQEERHVFYLCRKGSVEYCDSVVWKKQC